MVLNIIKDGQTSLRRPTLAGAANVLMAANAFKSQLSKKQSSGLDDHTNSNGKLRTKNNGNSEFVEEFEVELDDIKDQINEMRDAIEQLKEKDKKND